MDEHAYEVEAIHAERRSRKGGVQYLVKWLGWPDADRTWQSADSLDCPAVLRAWERKRA